jgi:methylmalonyl-CoA mutase C-terminal domain/subunit
MSKKKLRILVAKMGFDSHDRGIRSLSQLLRDKGKEVIYIGLHNSAERVWRAAVEEDVDVIGLSFLSGQHLAQTSKLINLLKEKGTNFKIIVGGIIPQTDVQLLKDMGVAEVFTPGNTSDEISNWLEQNIQAES